MAVISLPSTTVNKLGASLGASLDPQKLLLIGQKGTGTATEKVLIESVSEGDISTKFGYASELGLALDRIFKLFKYSGSAKLPQLDVIALNDAGAGVKATSTFSFSEIGGSTGVASSDGKFTVELVNGKYHSYEVNFKAGDSLTDIVQDLVDLVNADVKLPVTAVRNTLDCELTFDNAGDVGNNAYIKVAGYDYDGINWYIGNLGLTVTAFAGGATNPALTNIETIIGESNRYQTIVAPKYLKTQVIDDLLINRWNVNNDILDGVMVYNSVDTYANNLSLANTENYKEEVILVSDIMTQDLVKGTHNKDLSLGLSAYIGAVRALRHTEGANITNITPATSQGSLDGEGGIEIATLPYFNTPVITVNTTEKGEGYSKLETQNLSDAGATVVDVNTTNTMVLLGNVYTTYKYNTTGAVDGSFKFLNYVDALSVSAEYQFVNLKNDFAQSRLTTGDVKSDRAMVNEDLFRATMIKYYIELGEKLIVEAGDEAVKRYKKILNVNINMLAGKITATNEVAIVTQLREMLVYTKMFFS